MKKTPIIVRLLLSAAALNISFFAATSFGQQAKPVVSTPTAPAKADAMPASDLWRQVEVIRTAHGVPHIRAENLKAAGYALAWLQSEDYGPGTAINVLEASGRWAWVAGYERIESDFVVSRMRETAIKNYPQLAKETRDVYEGF